MGFGERTQGESAGKPVELFGFELRKRRLLCFGVTWLLACSCGYADDDGSDDDDSSDDDWDGYP